MQWQPDSSCVYNGDGRILSGVVWSVLCCLHEFFHQLPNLNSYLHSHSTHLNHASPRGTAVFLKHQDSLTHKLKTCYQFNLLCVPHELFHILSLNFNSSLASLQPHPNCIFSPGLPWRDPCSLNSDSEPLLRIVSWRGSDHTPALSVPIQTLPILQVPAENRPSLRHRLTSPRLEIVSASSGLP